MIDFNRHKGDDWNLQSWWQHESGGDLQRVTTFYSHRELKDYERTYRIITTQGVTDVNYYDDRLTGSVKKNTFGIDLESQWDVRRQLATWQLLLSLRHCRRSLTASVYPFYRQQETHLTSFTMRSGRSWILPSDRLLSLSVEAGWAGGDGTPMNDGVYQTPSDDAVAPGDFPLYRMREFEYLTNGRLLCGLGVRWSLPIDRQRMRIYLEGCYRYCQAFDIGYLLDGCRHQASMSVGCQF